MTATSRIADSWNVDGTIAALDGGALAARLDLARPESGLQSLRLQSAAFDVELLRISPNDAATWPAQTGASFSGISTIFWVKKAGALRQPHRQKQADGKVCIHQHGFHKKPLQPGLRHHRRRLHRHPPLR